MLQIKLLLPNFRLLLHSPDADPHVHIDAVERRPAAGRGETIEEDEDETDEEGSKRGTKWNKSVAKFGSKRAHQAMQKSQDDDW